MVFGKKMKAGSKRSRKPKANAGHGPGCSTPLPTAPSQGSKLLTLAHAVPGKKYRIIRVEGECKLSSRLCAMGLMPNELLSVYTASRGGPVIIAIKGSRFAIGRGMTNRIIIEET